MHPKLTRNRCRCTVCGLTFKSDAAFRTHRTGEFAREEQPNTRRCLTAAEMADKGLVECEGVWKRPPPAGWRFPLTRIAPERRSAATECQDTLATADTANHRYIDEQGCVCEGAGEGSWFPPRPAGEDVGSELPTVSSDNDPNPVVVHV